MKIFESSEEASEYMLNAFKIPKEYFGKEEEMEKETFEDYLQRLKDRRTEDNYKYTDKDFIKYGEYIRDCCKSGMSVYKCLEFMYFAEKEIHLEDIFNDEKKEIVIKVIQEHKDGKQ